jgi:hypothetical protein
MKRQRDKGEIEIVGEGMRRDTEVARGNGDEQTLELLGKRDAGAARAACRDTEVAGGNVAGETRSWKDRGDAGAARAAWQRYRSREKQRGEDIKISEATWLEKSAGVAGQRGKREAEIPELRCVVRL